MAEMDQLVAMLEEAGLVQVFVDDEGRGAYRLTEDGVRASHMLAMPAEAVRVGRRRRRSFLQAADDLLSDGAVVANALYRCFLHSPDDCGGPPTAARRRHGHHRRRRWVVRSEVLQDGIEQEA